MKNFKYYSLEFIKHFFELAMINMWVIWLAFSITFITGYGIMNWQFWFICVPTVCFNGMFKK